MELDHVVIAVADLDASAHTIEARFGLASVEGGRHPKWGTANRIVPLGDSYLELVTVVDALIAAESVFGRWVASGASADGRLLGWAARTHELDDVARRLELSVHAGSRAAPGGQVLRWRIAGIDQAASEPPLPFFIEWGRGIQFPGQAPVKHPAGAARIARLVLSADPARLAAWLGNQPLRIVVRTGPPALVAVHISSEAGEIVIGHEAISAAES